MDPAQSSGRYDNVVAVRVLEWWLSETKGELVRLIIRIHARYHVIAKKLNRWKYSETSQELRFNFLFAALMIHGLVRSFPFWIFSSSELSKTLLTLPMLTP